jgi:hypothetical protein
MGGAGVDRPPSLIGPARGTPALFAWRTCRGSRSLRGEQRPRQKSTARSRWQQGAHWHAMGWRREQTPYGTQAPAKSTLAIKNTRQISDSQSAEGPRCAVYCHAPLRARSSDKLPSPSLRSARVLTGLYSAFSNPVLERLGYGMANMRPARRVPIGVAVLPLL